MDAIIDTLTNNGWEDYLLALVILGAGAAAIRALQGVFDSKVKTYLESAESRLRGFMISAVEKGAMPVLYFAVFYAAAGSMYLNPRVERLIDVAGLVILCFFAARVAVALVDNVFEGEGLSEEGARTVKVIPKGVSTLLKLSIWAVAVIFLLDNLGFDITTLIAGLGIGGVALALASQAILGDLFNYFVILFDKPFRKGDFVIIGDKMGVVEYIGLKATRIKSLSGEEIIFANTDLANSRVHNYKKMERRRVAFRIGVTYQTPSEKLARIPGVIRQIIEGLEDTVFDRAHFFSYGDFALVFEIVYYVIGADYNKYMDIQQNINLAIKDEFEKLGVEFAYPTQTIYLAGEGREP
ncbi:MAG: mechanosensitive ion channel family protein [Candidatus Nitrospinota bacterium M3_3B_026]